MSQLEPIVPRSIANPYVSKTVLPQSVSYPNSKVSFRKTLTDKEARTKRSVMENSPKGSYRSSDEEEEDYVRPRTKTNKGTAAATRRTIFESDDEENSSEGSYSDESSDDIIMTKKETLKRKEREMLKRKEKEMLKRREKRRQTEGMKRKTTAMLGSSDSEEEFDFRHKSIRQIHPLKLHPTNDAVDMVNYPTSLIPVPRC